ncbi:glucokinase [bacterium]|nr:glucokinase [bacterium]
MTGNFTECLILAGDIGGTNTNLALVRHDGRRFEVLHSARFSTKAETSLVAPMGRFLEDLRERGLRAGIETCCISAAGPVKDGAIQLTNAPWGIVASELAERFGMRVHLINDFTAISYAAALIEADDVAQLAHIPHRDGSTPRPSEGIALVVGAGTGLGVGYMEKRADGSCVVYPSEGGHCTLPCYDDASYAFHRWMKGRIGCEPSAELGVSGQGIGNIFAFLCSGDFNPKSAAAYGPEYAGLEASPGPIAAGIMAEPELSRPASIAASRAEDPRCALAMEIFCNFYARVVSSLATAFYPSAGIYLAGGISSKNEAFLLEGRRFMNAFELNSEPHLRAFLSKVPVMIVRDYSISLIGAANAAVQLERRHG